MSAHEWIDWTPARIALLTSGGGGGMTIGGWLLVGITVAVVLVAVIAAESVSARLRKPVQIVLIGAVVLMAAKPHLWWVVWAAGMVGAILVVLAYIVASFVAEVQRWKETRR